MTSGREFTDHIDGPAENENVEKPRTREITDNSFIIRVSIYVTMAKYKHSSKQKDTVQTAKTSVLIVLKILYLNFTGSLIDFLYVEFVDGGDGDRAGNKSNRIL